MTKILNKDTGSFRDPANSVYQFVDATGKVRIIRGLREDALKNYKELITQEFYSDLSHLNYNFQLELQLKLQPPEFLL